MRLPSGQRPSRVQEKAFLGQEIPLSLKNTHVSQQKHLSGLDVKAEVNQLLCSSLHVPTFSKNSGEDISSLISGNQNQHGGQLGSLHGLLKARGLLPEKPLPGGEVRPLEQRVLQNTFHTSQGLDDICPVVVQVPAQHNPTLSARDITAALAIGSAQRKCLCTVASDTCHRVMNCHHESFPVRNLEGHGGMDEDRFHTRVSAAFNKRFPILKVLEYVPMRPMMKRIAARTSGN